MAPFKRGLAIGKTLAARGLLMDAERTTRDLTCAGGGKSAWNRVSSAVNGMTELLLVLVG